MLRSAFCRAGGCQQLWSPPRMPGRRFAMAAEEQLIVQVAQGLLKGRRATTKFGNLYYSFQGVPYAQPPVGRLRFQPPQPVQPWDGVRDALQEGSVCPHRDWIQGLGFRGDEDCLFLNIYTPELRSKGSEKIPVMVWIHGGGYYIGSGNTDMYGPDYLVEAGVVVVTLNYRLGALGFLSLEDSSVPGNIGLRDQVAALHWVQENIAKFGGDHNNITLFGESAGASCVQFHMLSPMSKGLFHKAIAQSGSVFNPWAMASTSLRMRAFKLGEVLGCHTQDSVELLKFLKTVTPKDLVEGSAKIITKEDKRRGNLVPFNPIPETNIPSAEVKFLPGHPEDLIKKRQFQDIPLMTGITSQEGILDLSGILKHPPLAEIIDKDFERVVPTDLSQPRQQSEEIAKEIKKFYFGEKQLTMSTLENISNCYTDCSFLLGVNKAVHEFSCSMSSPVYYYKFSFDGELGVFKKFIDAAFLPGASHIDDVGYLFRVSKLDIDIGPESEERRIIRKMVKMWTNFAKTGNPTPKIDEDINTKWIPYAIDNPVYLNINKTLTMEKNIFKDRIDFWKGIYKKYGNNLVHSNV